MTTSRPPIEQEYAAARPKSKALYERARAAMPNGAAHDGRVFAPFPFYVERAAGRPQVGRGRARVHRLLERPRRPHARPQPPGGGEGHHRAGGSKGLHYSACSELELRWAELIRAIVPGAERVRFTLTGTETTSLAVRVARAFTGRDYIIKFESHFHGVHDMFVAAVKDPFEIPASAGVPASTLSDHPGGALQRHRPRARAARRARGGGDHPRAGRWPLDDGPDQPRVPQGPARGDEEARRGADLRRGRDRLPSGRGRRAGVLRRDRRSHLPGQGGRRRPAGRRARRAGRSHGQHRVQRRRQARPHQARGRPGHLQRHAAGRRRRRRRSWRFSRPARSSAS